MRRISDIDGLCEFLRKNRDKRTLLTFHSVGDRDAISSAIALSRYLTNATIATPDFITHNAKRMLEETGYEEKIRKVFPSDIELIIVLDANNLPALASFQQKVMEHDGDLLFIDHHLAPVEGKQTAYIFDDESYSATCEIIFEVLKELGSRIEKQTGVLLLNGIVSDSAEFNNSTPRTFRDVAELLELCNMSYSDIMDYFHNTVSPKARAITINDIYGSNMEKIGKYLIIFGRATTHANVAADLAIKLGADFSLFWLVNEREATMSVRLRSPLDKQLNVHLGTMMREVGGMLDGIGGGHPCAAGAYGPKKEKIADAVNASLIQAKKFLKREGK